MAAAEIIMVRKYCVAILFFCYVEFVTFLYVERYNTSVLQLSSSYVQILIFLAIHRHPLHQPRQHTTDV